MTAALHGLRVIDLTSGPAGGLTTMMLADFGAEVLRIDDPTRSQPIDTLAAAPMWHRGKHRLPLNLAAEEDRARLDELCAAADVLVTTWRPQSLERKRLDAAHVRSTFPHLIYCHITGYGHEGPLANVPGYEHAAAALNGRMQLFQGLSDRAGPGFSALQVGVHACSQAAVSGILAALHAHAQTGEGETVRASLLQGLMAYEQGTMLGDQFVAAHPDKLPPMVHPTPEPPLPALYYHPAQAADGRWMQFGNLLPHLFDNFLVATDLIDVIADPDFNPKQLLLAPPKHEAFRERMLTRIASRTATDWMTDLIANGQVVAGTYQTTQEALDDPDIVDNGHVQTLQDGSRQLGPVARLLKTPAIAARAAEPGHDLAQLWQKTPQPAVHADTSPSSSQPSPQHPPLAGCRVLEIATIIAAPFGASLLADLGAEVIKVEQVGGDPYRAMHGGVGASRVNAGKRSISLDLKSDAGKAIIGRLAADADILIHNYRPGVPERLGFGYDQVRSNNPKIIYLQSNGYGPDGPGALRPSTHPIPGAAMGGVLYQLGHHVPSEPQDMDGLRLWTRRLMRANEVNPDPNTALVVATSALLGLAARDRHGCGQQILMDMFGANAYANHDDFIDYPDKPTRQLPDTALTGLGPTYRLYQCADDHWVFLAMTTNAEFERFVQALAVAAQHPEAQFDFSAVTLPSVESLQTPGPQLSDQLEQLLRCATAEDWERLLIDSEVACFRADHHAPSEYYLRDQQARAIGATTHATHPLWGPYQRHGAMVNFDTTSQPLGAPPLAGQHNLQILRELGYSREDITGFEDKGVLWSDPALGATS